MKASSVYKVKFILNIRLSAKSYVFLIDEASGSLSLWIIALASQGPSKVLTE